MLFLIYAGTVQLTRTLFYIGGEPKRHAMQHFPIFMAVAGRRIVLSGGGDAALAKLRLLLKTEANITVFAADPAPEIQTWAQQDRITLHPRRMEPGDAMCAVLFYAANEDATEDARVADIAHRDGARVNIVDNLADSQFITPAIVDRDPVVVAIGTEGAAPVLARAIKRDLEEKLPAQLGTLARIGKTFRRAVEVCHSAKHGGIFGLSIILTTAPNRWNWAKKRSSQHLKIIWQTR